MMSWLVLFAAVLVLSRLLRRARWDARGLGGGQYRWCGGGRARWDYGLSGRSEPQATSSPPAPAAPNPRRDLERTIDAVRQEYVGGRITVEEYERRLDELYRTAEGKRLAMTS